MRQENESKSSNRGSVNAEHGCQKGKENKNDDTLASSPIYRFLNPGRRGGLDSRPCHKLPKFISSASASCPSGGTLRPRYSRSSTQKLVSRSSSSESDSDPDWTAGSLVASAPLAGVDNPSPLVASFDSAPTTVPERVRRTLGGGGTIDPGETPDEAVGLAKSDARMVPARFRAGCRLTDFFAGGSAKVSRKERERAWRGIEADTRFVSPSECGSPAPDTVNKR